MAETLDGTMIVIAKTPVAGRVKTRLCPPLTFEQAADVAWACLLDSLDAAALVPARRHVLLLDGAAGPWVPDGFEVVTQRGHGLAERLANGFTDVADTGVLIAMDTPHVTPALLTSAFDSLAHDHDALIGPATDGGYWCIGLRGEVEPAAVFRDVPMSVAETGAVQLGRLQALGLRTAILPTLADLDTYDDLVTLGQTGRLAGLLALGGASNASGRRS